MSKHQDSSKNRNGSSKKLIGNVVIGTNSVPVYTFSARKLGASFGETVFDPDVEIHLRATLKVNQRRRVLVHECFHAFLYFSGYSESMESDKFGPNFEESLTRAFEDYLSHMFVFSKDIEKWLEGDND